MHWVVRIASSILLIATILPLVSSGKWFVRLFDFPRLQLIFLMAATLVPAAIAVYQSRESRGWLEPAIWSVLILAALTWQASHVLPFSPLWTKEVPDSGHHQVIDSIKIMVANINYENTQPAGEVVQVLDQARADILLIIENNATWMDRLKPLKDKYAYHCDLPRDEGLGMALWSRIPVTACQIRHLVSKRRGSLWATIQIEGREAINFVGVHPTPPGLDDGTGDARRDSRIRDAELVLVAEAVADRSDEHWIVAGDFNDVAWSHTTRLFKRTSGLSDPRIGRSFMGTFHSRYPVLRFPIDHVFLSSGFSLGTLTRTYIPGSDHFAVSVTVALTQPRKGAEPKPQGNDREDAEEIVEEGKQDAEDRAVDK